MPKDAIAFTGIAHPEDFFSKLNESGINIIEKYPLFDHFSYPEIFKKLLSSKIKKSNVPYITTEKDMVKLLSLPVDIKEKILYTKTKIKICKTGVDKLVEEVHKRVDKKRGR
jgi:tetraacyldisaccharide 4'-kinase